MEIDLSKAEIQLIDEAIEAWEREGRRYASLATLVARTFRGKDADESFPNEIREEAEKARFDRRVKSAQLRAKLLGALSGEKSTAV